MSGSESSVRGSDELSLYKSESLLKREKKKKAFRLLNCFIAPSFPVKLSKLAVTVGHFVSLLLAMFLQMEPMES